MEVDGINGGDGALLVVGMSILYVGGQSEGEVADGIVEVEAVLKIIVVDMRQAIIYIYIARVVTIHIVVQHQLALLVNRHAMEVEEIGLPVALHILGTIGSDTRSLVVVLARKHHDDWYVAGLNAEPQAKITIQPMGGVILK